MRRRCDGRRSWQLAGGAGGVADVGAARRPRVTTRSRPWPSADGRVGSVASVRSMAWLERPRASRRREDRVARPWQRVRRRPCRRCPRSSARCQRRSVSALTGKQDQRSRGSSLLAAASKARSIVVYWGPFPTATEDRELVAQHNDLELPLITLADEQAKKP